MANLGTTLGRCTRGRAIRYTVGNKCAFGTRWEFAVGVDGLCHFFARFSSHIVSWTAGNVDANAKNHMSLALLEAEIFAFFVFWLVTMETIERETIKQLLLIEK